MKKVYIIILFLMLMLPFKVNATGLTLNLSCPSSAKAGQTVSCTISGNVSNGTLIGLNAKFTYGNGLMFSSFTPASGWANYYSSSSGFSIGNVSGVTGNNKTFGTIKVTIPGSAAVDSSYTLTVGSIDGSDKDNNSLTTGNKTSTIRVLSGNNNLATLNLSNGTISFSPNTTTYSLTINAATTVVTASVQDSRSTFVSGYGSRTINLSYGTHAYYIKVKAANGDIKTYTLNITRPDGRSTDNSLKSLTVSKGKINFSPTTYEYSINVEKDVESIDIDGTVNHAKASFVNGYGKRTVKLNYGNNVVLVKVKAENGSEKTYTINVYRNDGRDNNNYIKNLEIDGYNINFNKETLDYKVKVLYETNKLDFNIITDSDKSKYDINGNDLKVGENTVTITVTAENEQKRVYTINVTKLVEGELLPSTNLNNIEIEGHKIDFAKDKLKYTVEVENGDPLNIKVELENKNSIYKIIGNKNLNDKDEITILVISTELDTKEYVIYIVRNEKDSAPILSIILIVILLLIIIFLYKKLLKTRNLNKKEIKKDDIYTNKREDKDIEINVGVENPTVEPIDIEELSKLNSSLESKKKTKKVIIETDNINPEITIEKNSVSLLDEAIENEKAIDNNINPEVTVEKKNISFLDE